jgi:hypothetical protein
VDRASAEKLMAIYERLNALLNDAAAVIETVPDHEEQMRLRRPVGEVMQSVWIDLMQPIVREYPHLDPDKRHSS